MHAYKTTYLPHMRVEASKDGRGSQSCSEGPKAQAERMRALAQCNVLSVYKPISGINPSKDSQRTAPSFKTSALLEFHNAIGMLGLSRADFTYCRGFAVDETFHNAIAIPPFHSLLPSTTTMLA
jgi:hypothetical protein